MSCPVLSIIVPVYNVEKYLSRCLDSILAQTFTDYECILVDDGSPDNCGNICDEYAEKDSRFRVIHQANLGVSEARNTALRAAQGSYFAFVDPDDYIFPVYAETMLKLIRQYGADMAGCGYTKVKCGEEKTAPVITTYTHQEFTEKILTDEFHSQLWQYVCRRELWQGIVSPSRRQAQDMMISFLVTDRAKRIVTTSEKLYFYYLGRSDNTTNAISKKTKGSFDRAIAFKMRYEYAKEHQYNSVLNSVMQQAIMWYHYGLAWMPVKSHNYDADIRDLSAFLKKYRKELTFKKQGMKYYVLGKYISRFPRSYCAFRKVIKRYAHAKEAR